MGAIHTPSTLDLGASTHLPCTPHPPAGAPSPGGFQHALRQPICRLVPTSATPRTLLWSLSAVTAVWPSPPVASVPFLVLSSELSTLPLPRLSSCCWLPRGPLGRPIFSRPLSMTALQSSGQVASLLRPHSLSRWPHQHHPHARDAPNLPCNLAFLLNSCLELLYCTVARPLAMSWVVHSQRESPLRNSTVSPQRGKNVSLGSTENILDIVLACAPTKHTLTYKILFLSI